MINKEILKIAKKAFINIIFDDNKLCIKRLFSLRDKFAWKLLFFGAGSLFLLILLFYNINNVIFTVFLILGVFFCMMSVFQIIEYYTDNVIIEKGQVFFRYKFKSKLIPVDINTDFKITTEDIEVTIRRGFYGNVASCFILVTLFCIKAEEIPIFKFQMDDDKYAETIELKEELLKLIRVVADVPALPLR